METDAQIKDYLIDLIRRKKKLQNLDPDLISDSINYYVKKNKLSMSDLSNEKSSKVKNLIKTIRAHFHDIYEIFQTEDISKREILLQNLEVGNLETYNKIMKTHLSTKERLILYPAIYQKIFKITGKPKSVLDLACGLNPFSIPYMDLPNSISYTASELCEADCNFIRSYFRKIGLEDYRVARLDLVNEYEKFKKYSADICFLFKVLDILETQKKNITYKVLENIKCKYIVASFSMRNIKGELMNRKKIHWFERMCRNLSYEWTLLSESGEFFYIVKKTA